MPLNQIRGLLGDLQSTSTISTVTRPLNDTTACMDVANCMDGTYICTAYNPRCFLLQKVNYSSWYNVQITRNCDHGAGIIFHLQCISVKYLNLLQTAMVLSWTTWTKISTELSYIAKNLHKFMKFYDVKHFNKRTNRFNACTVKSLPSVKG